MIHIPDKPALYAEVHRVLVPGGWMLVGDWFGNGLEPTRAMREWLDAVDLTFTLESIEASAALVAECGFVDVEWRDRNAWYAEAMSEEIATLSGENYPRLVERVGAEAAAQRLESSTKKKAVVDGGELRPRPSPRPQARVTAAPARRSGEIRPDGHHGCRSREFFPPRGADEVARNAGRGCPGA